MALVLSPRFVKFRKMRLVWGDTLVIFSLVAGVVFASTVVVAGHDLVRVLVFTGRQFEPFVLATVVAGLMLNIGDGAARAVLRALHLSAVLNGAWVAYQMTAGEKQTIFGDSVSDLIGAYGPKLVGEPSTFGTGFYFVFVAVLAVAEYRSRIVSRRLALLLLGVAAFGAYAAQSRISMGAIAILTIWLGLRSAKKVALARGIPVLFFALLAAVVFVVAPPDLGARFTPEQIDRGVGVRIDQIWTPILQAILDHPLFGLGPGALGTEAFPQWSEAHNIILRGALDWGMPGLIAMIAIYVSIWRTAGTALRDSETAPDLTTFAEMARGGMLALLMTGMVQDSTIAVMSSHLTMLAVGGFAGIYIRHEVDREEAAPVGCGHTVDDGRMLGR